MPVSKLSMKVLDELNVETYSPEARKIDIAISSRAQYLVDLKNHENLYLSNLQKLLAYAQTSLNLSSDTQLIEAINSLIACHVQLYKILDLYISLETNQLTPLQEVYCFRDISQWCLKFNAHYIRYSQHYNYNPFLPEFTSNLIKLPFIRYKALVKLLTKFYQLSLHFENSLPHFEFKDMSLRFLFVEITKNFQRSAKFSSVQWSLIKDYLNNEKLYLDYFSINFNLTRDMLTLQPARKSSFRPNNILKRDYFEFEFYHPLEKTNNKKIIELVLLSDKQVNDFDKLHKSHTTKSLEKLSNLESKQDFLAAANSEVIDTVFDSIINADSSDLQSSSLHNRDMSDLSMISTDAVEESYKGSLDFKFTEISGLAVCAIDSNIGRNLIFPAFDKNSLFIKSINKAINEIVLVPAHKYSKEGQISVKISCLDEEQFNNWTPFFKVLFPYYTNEPLYFKQHERLKNQMEFTGALGINLNNDLGSATNFDNNIAPLKITKKRNKELSKRAQHAKTLSQRSAIDIPELDLFLEQLEAKDKSSPGSDNFHFDEITYANTKKISSPLVNGISRTDSKSSRLSKSQKINNFEEILKEDDESDWTSITTSTTSSTVEPRFSLKVVKSYYNDTLLRQNELINKKRQNPSTSSGVASIDEFKYLRMPSSHSDKSCKATDQQQLKVEKPIVPTSFATAFKTPDTTIFASNNGSTTSLSTAERLYNNSSTCSSQQDLSLIQAAEELTKEFSSNFSSKPTEVTSKATEKTVFEKAEPKKKTAPLLRKLFGRSKKTTESNKRRQSFFKLAYIDNGNNQPIVSSGSYIDLCKVDDKHVVSEPEMLQTKQLEETVISKKKVDASNVVQISPSQKRLSSYQSSMKRRSHAANAEQFAISKSSSRRSFVSKSSSKPSLNSHISKMNSSNSNKKLSAGIQLEISQQQKLFEDLLNSKSPFYQSTPSSSPSGSKYNIPNNYSVSALTSPININLDFAKPSNSPIQIHNTISNIQSPSSIPVNRTKVNLTTPVKLNFGKLQPDDKSPSENSFLSHSTSVSNASFVTGLTHQETSTNDLNVILEDATTDSFNNSKVTVVEKLPEFSEAVISDDEDIPVPKEEFLKEEEKKQLAQPRFVEAGTDSSEESSDSEDENDNEGFTSNTTYLNNFGKNFEPKFYSPEKKNKKYRLSSRLSLKKKKSVDFEMVTKKTIQCQTIGEDEESSVSPASATFLKPTMAPTLGSPKSVNRMLGNESKVSVATSNAASNTEVQRANSTYTSKSEATNFSILSSLNNSSKETITKSKETITSAHDNSHPTLRRKGSFDALRKIASPLPSVFGKSKNKKNLQIHTSASPASSSVSTPIKSSNSAQSVTSIADQYVKNMDNCVIIYKDYFYVSYWKSDHWAAVSDDHLYLEIAISVNQSYLCFYRGDSLKSLASIKPFITLPVNSSSCITKNANNLDVQIKTFNELTKKTSLILMRPKTITTVNTLIQALEYAQKDHTKNSLVKTRQQVSESSSNSLFYNESLSSGNSNQAGDMSVSGSVSSTSAPPSESSMLNFKGKAFTTPSSTKQSDILLMPGSFSLEELQPPLSARSNISFANSISSPTSQTSSEYLAHQEPFSAVNNYSVASLNSQMGSLDLCAKNKDNAPLSVRKIRLHKKSSISGKWNPLTISKLLIFAVPKSTGQKFRVVINEHKTNKIIIDATVDGSKAQRIGRTGVCVVVQSKDGTSATTNRPNYLLESRNETEANELFDLLASSS